MNIDSKAEILEKSSPYVYALNCPKIVSATSIFGHETVHAFNFSTNPSDYFKRKRDISTRSQIPSFTNAEEAKTTTLSNLINVKLSQPQRNNYRAIGVSTQGILSNEIKR